MKRRPLTMFGQLTLVIGLVLLGTLALALALARGYALTPGADQVLHVLDAHASALETVVRQSRAPEAALRSLGLNVSARPPQLRPIPLRAPLLREVLERAPAQLGSGRALAYGRGGERGRTLWLRLAGPSSLWVAVPLLPRAGSAFGLSVSFLLGAALLGLLAAGWAARRLVQPLRQLAEAAPGVARGESPQVDDARAPREVGELASALQHAAADVRAAAQDRALMLAGISHDLRTPLTRLQFALELLPETDPALREGMQRDIAEIEAILAQFVAYARDGRDEASEPVDLAAICRAVLDAASGDWQIELPERAPLQGKPLALQRAVENLVVNAVRHGAAPFALALSVDDGGWRVAVRDGGPGLAPELRERVRQPFVRGGDGGTGLGLAIVERVARQHDGWLELRQASAGGLEAVLVLKGT